MNTKFTLNYATRKINRCVLFTLQEFAMRISILFTNYQNQPVEMLLLRFEIIIKQFS